VSALNSNKGKIMIKILILTVALLFSGCATKSYDNAVMQDDVESIAKASNTSSKLYAIQVPAADNTVSEKIALVAMDNMAELTKPAKSIKNKLLSGNVQQLGVIGQSEAMNIATIKQVIHALEQKVNATLYTVVKENNYDELKDLAHQKGVELVFIVKNSGAK
jgi:hypothetical protein